MYAPNINPPSPAYYIEIGYEFLLKFQSKYILQFRDLRQHGALKRWYPTTTLHSVIIPVDLHLKILHLIQLP
jgi:hypothetical protein